MVDYGKLIETSQKQCAEQENFYDYKIENNY